MPGLTLCFVEYDGSDAKILAEITQLAAQIQARFGVRVLTGRPEDLADRDTDLCTEDDDVELLPPAEPTPAKPKTIPRFTGLKTAPDLADGSEDLPVATAALRQPAATKPTAPRERSEKFNGNSYRDKAVAFIRNAGAPQRKIDVLRAIGAGVTNYTVFKCSAFRVVDGGLVALNESATTTGSSSIATSNLGERVLTSAVNAIAAELVVDAPLTLKKLQKATNFKDHVIQEALKDKRFKSVPGGWQLKDIGSN
jgi:hypothetical protein